MTYEDFIEKFTGWCQSNSLIEAAGIVGSYARGEQTETSDIDVLILSEKYQNFLTETDWLNIFGTYNKIQFEDWGAVTSIRSFFNNGLEIEFSFSDMKWADIPVDPGTSSVASRGLKILYDPMEKLKQLKIEVERV